MTVRLALRDEYFQLFPKAGNVYGSKEFDAVTAANAEAVRYFVGYDERMRPRIGLIAGYGDGRWHAPYSAPFADVAYTKPQQLERIYDFISELTDMLGAPLDISLPPDFYDPAMLPKISGIFGNYASEKWVDFDYYYPLDLFDSYIDSLDHASRKNLNRALGLDYHLECFSIAPGGIAQHSSEVERMYNIIAANRQSHGYPLAMSLEQVQRTLDAIGGDCFVLGLDTCHPDLSGPGRPSSQYGVDVAAALVYQVAPGIAQVIYWGDMPGYTESRPMNMLAYRVFGHYHARGMHIVDVGPSSTRGIPNSGLCRFKESIGCRVALKPSFVF